MGICETATCTKQCTHWLYMSWTKQDQPVSQKCCQWLLWNHIAHLSYFSFCFQTMCFDYMFLKNISTFLPCHLATRSSLANTCNWPYWDEPGARCPVRKDLAQRWPAGKSKGGTTLQQELELRVGANAGCCCLLFEKKMGMVNGWTRTTKSQLRN